MSGRGMFREIRFCTSVLANTPQREATGKTFLYSSASSASCSTGIFIRSAIWSINEPVPPAQLPFIRISGCFPSSKKTILASSPPRSISVRALLYRSCTTRIEETTSCTNEMPVRSETPIPAEPVTPMVNWVEPSFWKNERTCCNSCKSTWLKSALWRRYTLCFTSPKRSSTTIFKVVEPISIPMLYFVFIVIFLSTCSSVSSFFKTLSFIFLLI